MCQAILLLKVLEETIGKMIEEIMFSFRTNELHVKGMYHNKALHITVKYGDKVISRVLIEGGFGLNIPILYSTRTGYSFQESERKPCKSEGFWRFVEGCHRRYLLSLTNWTSYVPDIISSDGHFITIQHIIRKALDT